ncbi:hypothetical protein [Amycolatopsis regifaucium]|uniref:Uncharacterized protein n=1 Tax=Amycolatopsis regifaucium TaxID=546365 RepID=A0A154MVS0_9PSEU|nr:hypothetical protein [Amycolatopsis regifaucium]KZB88392.1 hypothetical protein AVL48_20875 [Amycolatopsis regifaucium]OKA11502.1 hypothetical protein ATP06_0201270 [Amycolatopsis regifaucium]SFH40008.1 hypothetical protein SAMN04489731_1043 [Amycolatopsis regifaucium]
MSAGDVTGAHPDRAVCVLDTQYPYFYLSENTALINPGVSTWTGMVTASSGKLKLQVPWTAKRVRVVAEVHSDRPEDVIENYDDVIEFGYWSATGLAAVLDWSRTLASPLELLPGGAGDYRLRYHVREYSREAADLGSERGAVAEALIQLWPAKLGGKEELRITGALGTFWHPGSRLKTVWND